MSADKGQRAVAEGAQEHSDHAWLSGTIPGEVVLTCLPGASSREKLTEVDGTTRVPMAGRTPAPAGPSAGAAAARRCGVHSARIAAGDPGGRFPGCGS